MTSRKESARTQSRVRINMVVEGEPAEWLNKWKQRGLITSYTDAVVQALRVYNEKITEQDLKIVQLNNIKFLEKD